MNSEEKSGCPKPRKTDEIIYSDEQFRVRKMWEWEARAIHEDKETGFMKVLLDGVSYNWNGLSALVSVDGDRLTDLTFDYLGDFRDGLALVHVHGQGYGFIDRDMRLVIPMQYDEAEEFSEGMTKVRCGKRWFYIDQNGRELPEPSSLIGKYQNMGVYSEGMCQVSTVKMSSDDLAFHIDGEETPGNWGYVNEKGEEVIKPQYIFSTTFRDGFALVAKGKWTIDPAWDNEFRKGCYWSEEQLWGVIDKTGKEIVPCIYDEINYFSDVSDMYLVHAGGWTSGHWGVIDLYGKRLVEPVFRDVDRIYHDGIFPFYANDKDSDSDALIGVYDLKQNKVLFEPQFADVSFLDDGGFIVEVYDKTLKRMVEKVIDRDGKERFPSNYTSIYGEGNYFIVTIRDEEGSREGLLDQAGNVIVPCEHETAGHGFYPKQKRFVFVQDGKQGVRDFDGKVIIPAIYREIYGLNDPFLTVRVGDGSGYREGLIAQNGEMVLPARYQQIVWLQNHTRFSANDCQGQSEMYRVERVEQS